MRRDRDSIKARPQISKGRVERYGTETYQCQCNKISAVISLHPPCSDQVVKTATINSRRILLNVGQTHWTAYVWFYRTHRQISRYLISQDDAVLSIFSLRGGAYDDQMRIATQRRSQICLHHFSITCPSSTCNGISSSATSTLTISLPPPPPIA